MMWYLKVKIRQVLDEQVDVWIWQRGEKGGAKFYEHNLHFKRFLTALSPLPIYPLISSILFYITRLCISFLPLPFSSLTLKVIDHQTTGRKHMVRNLMRVGWGTKGISSFPQLCSVVHILFFIYPKRKALLDDSLCNWILVYDHLSCRYF